MSSRNVLVSCIHLQRRLDDFRAEFEAAGYHVEAPEVRQQLEEAWLLEHIGRFDGMIAGDDPLSRDVLAAGVAGNLRAVVKWGIGVDAIDLDAAAELGVPVENTPGMFADEVADVAIGYVIMLARELHAIHQSVVDGGWYKPVGMTLRGRTLGLIGLGSIGSAIGDRARALGMEVVGYDPFAEPGSRPGVRVAPLEDVLASADVLALACSLNEDNHHLIDEAAIASMKAGSYLVNVARGPLVDESALVPALASGHIAAAALDVFEEEPLAKDHPLRTFEHCIFGSHNGSNTREAVDRVNRLSVDRLLALLASA